MQRIDGLIEKIKKTVEKHCLGLDGVYARWLWQDERGTRNLGINEYGCADAVNILYTIGVLPGESEKRNALITSLAGLQDPETGMFQEPTHHPIHTTAHCIAALELFDVRPRYPLYALEKLTDAGAMEKFLDGLAWREDPWSHSHRSAGVYAAMKLCKMVDQKWEDRYFDWLYREADPDTGLWRSGCIQRSPRPIYEHMAGSFHLLFNHEYAKRPLRYPERMIDTCLKMYRRNQLKEAFGREINFIEVDWIYCLNRASRQTPYRYEECKAALREFAEGYIAYLNAVDTERNEEWNDLHLLFGMLCALAELQQALYGEILSDQPLRLALDRRPFI